MKGNTITFLDDNTKEYFLWPWSKQGDFLNRTHTVLTSKARKGKLTISKWEGSTHERKPLTEWKKKVSSGEKIFAIHINGKGLMSRIYPEHFNQNKRWTEKKREREREDMNKELTNEDRQVANKWLKKCLISLFGEIQMKAHNDITRHIHQNS